MELNFESYTGNRSVQIMDGGGSSLVSAAYRALRGHDRGVAVRRLAALHPRYAVAQPVYAGAAHSPWLCGLLRHPAGLALASPLPAAGALVLTHRGCTDPFRFAASLFGALASYGQPAVRSVLSDVSARHLK